MASVFTTVGKQWVVDKMRNAIVTDAKYIAWGTGAGIADIGDTTLFTEATETRVVGVVTSPSAAVYQTVGTIVANGGKTITNAGVFDATTVGVLVLKGDHAGIPLLAGDSVEYTFQLQVT